MLPLAELPDQHEARGPHDAEVEDHGHEDAEYGPEVVQDVVALVREHDKDRVQQPKERERGKYREEAFVEEVGGREDEHREARQHPKAKRNSEVLQSEPSGANIQSGQA